MRILLRSAPGLALALPLAVPLAVPLALSAAAAAQCTYSWPAATFAGGCNDAVEAIALAGDGSLIVGGRFTTAGGVGANRIARWNGSAWSPLGSGMNGDVLAIAVLPNGDVVAGGSFTTAGGGAANCIARWNGVTWSPLGSGMTGVGPFGCSVQTLLLLANGDLVAGGSFADAGGVTVNNVARWNGSTWSTLGGGLNGAVRALVADSGAQLFAAGGFSSAGGMSSDGLARWNGTAWQPLAVTFDLFGVPTRLATDGNAVWAGGTFLTVNGASANRIAQVWPSAAALGLGVGGPVASMLALPNGDLVVGGLFTQAGGAAANRVARWDGASWSTFGSGADDAVLALGLGASGQLVVGGAFQNVPAGAVGRLATVASSCGPQVTGIGSGCTGSGGPNVLVATQLPLAGTRFVGTGTGFVANSIVLAITGLSTFPPFPIAAVFPQAFAGCTLDANLDLIDLLTPVAGAARSTLVFPYAPSTVGLAFYHQHAAFEYDLVLGITGVSSTNALQVTIGDF